MSLNKLREYWPITVVVCCAATATAIITWYEQARVPGLRDHIAFLEDQLDHGVSADQSSLQDPKVLDETGVHEGEAVTTRDGVCSIRVVRVIGDTVTLKVTSPFDESEYPMDLVSGESFIKSVPGATYFIYLLGIRGNIADVSAFRVGVPTESQPN